MLITFIVARGAHLPLARTSEEMREEQVSKLGEEIVENYRVITHDAYDPRAVKYIGTSSLGTPIWIDKEVLSADFKVGIGRLAPHDNMGYSGGAKIILPSISSIDTVNITSRDPFP